ncbi:hypothetical protein Lesp02_52410 [Lentzea sp. NBRC 105346]|uniref:DUF2339 domain-containing protein n=1 Tax=Lentzea sp. NBRC 105346 TaxID=3032205 RepID=UPI0024A142EB|nr:DUF2339 domain-containing protein [Lentzea sp. NBRC 105346]GLZ33053.1 hypothetical protein Lesp02_52410 [Lentzea sp. NBRC 105346]
MTGQDRYADELAAIGQRLVAISAELRMPLPAPAAVPVPPPAPQQAYYPPPQPQWQPPQPMQPRETVLEKLGKDGAGSKILAWVGGAITVLGVVLLLVLAIQRGYLGPLPRVIVGAIFSGVLVGIGMWLHRNPTSRTGAFALAATGIAGLYLDVIAATSLYEFLPSWAGLLVGLAVAGGGLALAMRWDSQTLATGVVVACAVCAPVLTSGFTPLLVAFLLVLKMTSTPIQLQRSWPALAIAGGVPPILASIAATGAHVGTDEAWTTVGVAVATWVLGAGVAIVTVRRRPEDPVAIALVAGSAFPALIATSLLERPMSSTLAGVVAALLLALWMVPDLPKPFTTAAGAVGMLALFQTTVIALDGTARTATVLAEAVLLAYVAVRLDRRTPLVASAVFGLIGLLMTVGEAVPPRLLLEEPRGSVPGDLVAGMITALVLGVFAGVLPWAATRLNVLREPGKHPVPWFASGLVLLYGAAGFVLCGALLMSPDETGFLFGHSVVTVSWTIAALVLLVRGIDVLPLRVAGLVLVGAAVLKLLLFDMAALDGMARVAAFLGAGLVLLTAGTRYAKLVASRKISTDTHS